MKITKKILAVILCVVMAFSVMTAAFTVSAKEEVTPVVFVPGIGQSQTYKYDDEGNVVAEWNLLHVNTDFASFSIFDWIKLVKFVAEFITSICTQKDVIAPSSIEGILKVFFSDHLNDENGNPINNVVTPLYEYPVSEYDEEARDIFDDRIPCQVLLDEIGEENVYCYNYPVFSNADQNAIGLNDFIENVVLKQTGAKKVILAPMSMGASVVNNYLNQYPDAGRVAKVISIVGAWDGSDVFGDLMLADFDDNAPAMVYTNLLGELGFVDPYVGSIINIAARILPKQELRNILDDIVDSLVKTLFLTNTSFLSLCPSGRYDEFAEKYLQGDDMAEVREQTARYAEAQRNLEERLMYQQEKYGTEFYFISGYNLAFGDEDYGFFKFFETYDTTNSDEIIQISSTAPGTSYVPAGQSFSAEYIADPAHNVSPDGSIDASTCYFEDTSWYFEGQKHELTDNNTALSLAFEIALGNIHSVEDCKDTYPQFNDSRFVRRLTRDYLPDAAEIDRSTLDAADAARLDKAVADAEAMMARTINDREADDEIIFALKNLLIELNVKYGIWEDRYQPEQDDPTMDAVEKVLGGVSDVLVLIFGKKGFADFWSFLYE
ncbi:MAG: alpha/beta hydrolase [Clostridia bacterium]|nr:alpha/beta hydrolase [Clostridia bacterium]